MARRSNPTFLRGGVFKRRPDLKRETKERLALRVEALQHALRGWEEEKSRLEADLAAAVAESDALRVEADTLRIHDWQEAAIRPAQVLVREAREFDRKMDEGRYRARFNDAQEKLDAMLATPWWRLWRLAMRSITRKGG